jgi:hypothetical protein
MINICGVMLKFLSYGVMLFATIYHKSFNSTPKMEAT